MNFIGHRKNWELLVREASLNRLPPAYLFYGTPGIGKKRVALAFVARLFGREIEGGVHPDFHLIEAEGETIKIEAIRSCQAKLQRAPLEALLKVVLIDEAGSLTRQAANSLLKVLEEPPRDTLFILITRSLFQILPTIRSRCRRLFFSAPPVLEMAAYLGPQWNLPPDKLRSMLEDVDGSAGLLSEILADEMAGAAQHLDRLFSGKSPSFSDTAAAAQELARKEIDLPLLLEVQKKRLFRRIVADSNFLGLDKIDRISEAQRDIEGNVNKALVLENLVMDLTS
ncbi:MAG: AAA family ATPase [Deltaproteobacteria bacterium]|nr:AAA family ATPase [Deltaproteobacteria bacterium]